MTTPPSTPLRETHHPPDRVSHPDATGKRIGLAHAMVASPGRDELVEWQRRLKSLGVEHTPIRDMELGYQLNFRDPDNIALELSAPNKVLTGFYAELQNRELSRPDIESRVHEYLASVGRT